MSYAEDWGHDIPDDFNDEYGYSYSPPLKTCKYCGKTGLHWENKKMSWKLHEPNGAQHFCHVLMEEKDE